MAGNCRYGDHCHYLHGMPCPSCLKHVLHPYSTPEEHQGMILTLLSEIKFKKLFNKINCLL